MGYIIGCVFTMTCIFQLLNLLRETMKKKYHESDEENEFDVDEPEEIQNNATDDEWTPDKDVITFYCYLL